MSTNSDDVKRLVKDWADAISRVDRDAILRHHADDLLMYDFPNEVRGLNSYDGTWDFFFENKRGPITFAPSNMQATAGERVAFVTCNMHCDGTSAGPLDFRLTVGLEKRNGEWVITHEHHSLPTHDSRFIDDSPRRSAASSHGSTQ
jgi:ketosteroid isomerase-like protein